MRVEERRGHSKRAPKPVALVRPLIGQEQIFWEFERERSLVPASAGWTAGEIDARFRLFISPHDRRWLGESARAHTVVVVAVIVDGQGATVSPSECTKRIRLFGV